ncbi:MAG: M14 family metallopeptidase [Thiolinea sp.]
MITVQQNFDAGNIEVMSLESASDIRLKIRPDSHSDFFQWFYFRVSGGCDTELGINIINAGEAAFTDGWEGYQALASYDQQYWFRVPTEYADGQLQIRHQPEYDAVYYAYFTPYPQTRHAELIAWAQTQEGCRLTVAGNSLQQRPLDVLTIGDETEGKQRVWVIARQHPGESMAEWLIEGLLERLLDTDDALAERLRGEVVFHIVPNMNPDGSFLGNLRTNAAGVNLNRVWGIAEAESSPEVFYIQRMMEQQGCDLFLDIHGDEAIPYNFIAGQLGAPVAEEILAHEARFKQRLMAVNPDFQLEHGYAPDRFGPEMLTLASYWVGNRFGIPALTLEMPFKDNLSRPDPECGWSAQRSKRLGASLVGPVWQYFAG